MLSTKRGSPKGLEAKIFLYLTRYELNYDLFKV